MINIPQSARRQNAQLFLNYFRGEFKSLNGNEVSTFLITREQFAEFMFDNNMFPPDWGSVPTQADPVRWHYMRSEMNKVRTQMNKAASLGLHGEPPFEAKINKEDKMSGDITVYNLQGMAMVTYSTVGEALQTYLKNKIESYARKHEFLTDEAVISQLPATLRSQIVGVDLSLNMCVGTAAASLAIYISQVDALAAKVEAELQVLQLGLDEEFPMLDT